MIATDKETGAVIGQVVGEPYWEGAVRVIRIYSDRGGYFVVPVDSVKLEQTA